MKKSIIMVIAALLVLITGCGPVHKKGFIVCKEYTTKHMCHDTTKTVQEAIIVPVHTHHHREVETEWLVYLANKDGVYQIRVEESDYNKLRVGQRWGVVLK